MKKIRYDVPLRDQLKMVSTGPNVWFFCGAILSGYGITATSSYWGIGVLAFFFVVCTFYAALSAFEVARIKKEAADKVPQLLKAIESSLLSKETTDETIVQHEMFKELITLFKKANQIFIHSVSVVYICTRNDNTRYLMIASDEKRPGYRSFSQNGYKTIRGVAIH